MQKCEESTVTNVAVYLGPFFALTVGKMPKGKKENCELGLCQMELAMEFIRNAGFDRNVE